MMNLKPLYRNESRILLGLVDDFAELCVLDGLVVEVDVDSKRVLGDPYSGFRKLQSGSYTPIRQHEKKEYCRLVERKLRKKIIRSIEEKLERPPTEAISSLTWVPQRLGGSPEGELV